MIKYLSDKELTDKVLTINKETNVKTLNTMDIGRYMEDGSICLLGRSDSVVNIRGKRVALGEVEYWLSQAPGVNEAAVASFVDYNNQPIICGYYQTYDYKPIEHEQIMAYLSQKISDYMIPKYLIFVKMFARNQNGKIDRSKLEKPSISSYQSNYVAPTTKTTGIIGKTIKLTKTDMADIFPKLKIKKGDEKIMADKVTETDSATKTLNLEYKLKLTINQLHIRLENKTIPKHDEKDKTKDSPKTVSEHQSKSPALYRLQ